MQRKLLLGASNHRKAGRIPAHLEATSVDRMNQIPSETSSAASISTSELDELVAEADKAKLKA